MGFVQAPTVTEPGDYAIRGGIIDIFPPGEGGPVRLDFFGDVLDGARRFDAATQRTTEKLSVVELSPVSEVILDEAAITRFRQNYRLEFGAAGTDDPLYEAVSCGAQARRCSNIGCRSFTKSWRRCSIICPRRRLRWTNRTPAMRAGSRWEADGTDQYDARREAMTAKGRVDSVYKAGARPRRFI